MPLFGISVAFVPLARALLGSEAYILFTGGRIRCGTERKTLRTIFFNLLVCRDSDACAEFRSGSTSAT